MDRIFINGLQVETIIGIYDWERETRQRVVIDLEMSADISTAAAAEKVESTLDYKVLSDHLIEFIQQSQFQLIETLAESIVYIVRQEFGVQWLRLVLHKPDALTGATDVGVILERGSLPHGG